jgi:hypothetical protein
MPTDEDVDSADTFHKRAQEDYSQFSQHLRMSLQFVFAANGGAALAMLSCLTAVSTSKDVNAAISVPLLLSRFAWSALFYLAGVLCAVLSLCAYSASKQNWGHFWEDNALTGNVDFRKTYARRGELQSKVGFGLLLVGAIVFVPGSITALAAFLRW